MFDESMHPNILFHRLNGTEKIPNKFPSEMTKGHSIFKSFYESYKMLFKKLKILQLFTRESATVIPQRFPKWIKLRGH